MVIKNFSFGIKLNFKATKPKYLTYVRLQHTTNGHNKYYIMTINPFNSVITEYGKIGTLGSSHEKNFKSIEEAQNAVTRKLKEQLSKGYIRL